jgi:site-specific DNA recombinase
MKKRAVLYARVSGDDRGKEGRNLKGQLDMCRRYAKEQDWKIVAELAEDDRGASGASFELPELNRAREMARAGEFDVLVVREIDRLSRKLAKQLIVEEELNRMGVQVDYVLADYDDTPEGRLNKHIRATIAEYEREKINERMVRGRWLKVQSGHVLVHSIAPYGYRKVVGENGKNSLEIYEAEARIVEMIFNWYARGFEDGEMPTMQKIANKLTEMKIPTRLDTARGRGGYKKMGWGQWNRATISKILGGDVYKGVWYYGKSGHDRDDWAAVEVPAIVDEELWDQVEKLRKRNQHTKKYQRKHRYLLTGHIKCGHCGTGIYGHPNIWRSKNARGLNLYYRCAAVDKLRVNVKCDLPQFRVVDVDNGTWEWVRSILLEPDFLDEGLNSFQQHQAEENVHVANRMDVIDDLLADNQAQLERLIDLYLAGEFSKDMLVDRKTRLETTIESLNAEKTNLIAYLEARTLTQEQVNHIREFVSEMAKGVQRADEDFDRRRQMIELLDVQVTLLIENDIRKVKVSCVFGADQFTVSTNSHENIEECQIFRKFSTASYPLSSYETTGDFASQHIVVNDFFA